MESSSRPRVLIVDDEPRVADAIARVLSDDYEVEVATRPRDAVARMIAGDFDIILCDVLMPEMLGIDVHTAVSRERPETATRIVFMTGGVLPLRARDFLARVGNPCFEKPIEAARLRALVRERIDARKNEPSRGSPPPPSSSHSMSR